MTRPLLPVPLPRVDRHAALVLAVAVLLLAAATRILGANDASLWTDEGASLYIAGSPVERLLENHHPPLYFFALGAWQSLAGESRLALRFLAVLAGVLAAAVVYRLGREWLGPWPALGGAALFAASGLAVEYAQQVRHYGWLVLGVSLMAWTLLRALRRPSAGRLVAYGLSLTFAFYAHYLAFLMFPVHLVAVLLWGAPWRRKARLALAWALAAILYLPWLVAIQHLLLLAREQGLASRPGMSRSTLDALFQIGYVMADGAALLLVPLVLVGAWRLLRGWDRSAPATARLFLLVSGAGMFVAMFVMNQWLRILTPRTLVFLAPFLALAAGAGLAALPARLRPVVLAAALAWMLAVTPVVQPRYDSDVAAAEIAARHQPGDLVILETGADDNAYAYEVRRALADPTVEIIRTLPWVGTRGGVRPVVPEILPALERHDRVWVVQWLQAASALPYLQSPESGYRQTLALDVPVGEEYAPLFPAPIIQVALFER